MARTSPVTLLLTITVLAAASAAAQTPAGTRRHAVGAGTSTLDIPAGTYTTTLTKADVRGRVKSTPVDSMVGAWTVAFDDNGHFTVQRNGVQVVDGVAQPRAGHRVYFDAKDTGSGACHSPATYRYAVRGDRLTFHTVSEGCDGRLAVLTAHPLARKS